MTDKNYEAALAKAIADAKATGADMRVAKKGGGGDYVPPEKGLAQARLVGYFELGVHEVDEINDAGQKTGKKKDEDQVQLVFELSGPRHAPKVLDDGTKLPHRLSVTLKKSLHPKAGFYKLFQKMNYDGAASHMIELLYKPFLCTVYHRKGQNDKVFPTLKGNANTDPVGEGFAIGAPVFTDPMTGKDTVIDVAPAITPKRGYLFDTTDKAMWDALFIAGEYEARKDEKTGEILAPAKSKNVIQDKIKAAKNFKGSAMALILAGGGADLDMPDGDVPDLDNPDDDPIPF